MPTPQKIILVHTRAPGDTMVLTALVRDIALAYPGQFEIDVHTHAMELWQNNPYLTHLKSEPPRPDVRTVVATYGEGLREQNYEVVHFLPYFHRDFERQTGIKVPLMRPYPDVHLSEHEKNTPLVPGRYWVFLSGGKSDFPIKIWYYRHWQTVVQTLGQHGVQFVQTGAQAQGHWHPPVPGVINLVGKNPLREMLQLIYHAEGVICGVTCAMHMAAALQKPCVVIAGGREAWWWEAYVPENHGLGGPQVAQQIQVPHRFLHTIGLLDCCQLHGCWRNKVVEMLGDKHVCKYPVQLPNQPVAKCMTMITPQHVIDAVLSYYLDGTLPPLALMPRPQLQSVPA